MKTSPASAPALASASATRATNTGRQWKVTPRAKVGLVIFAVLILANIYVYGMRWIRARTAAGNPAGASAGTSGTPGVLGSPTGTAGTAGTASADRLPENFGGLSRPVMQDAVAQAANLETMANAHFDTLQKNLQERKERLTKLPKISPAPVLVMQLPLVERNLLLPRPLVAPRLAGPATAMPVAETRQIAAIIGYFSVSGQTRALVQLGTDTLQIFSELGHDNAVPAEHGYLALENGRFVLRDPCGREIVSEERLEPSASLAHIRQIFRGMLPP